MKGMQPARGGEDLRTLRVARVRTTLNLNRQQHFLDAHFLSLKASRLESMLAELDRRRDRVEGQLRGTREELDRLLADDRTASSTRPPSSRIMRIDY
jgi:hypothetical protein